MQLIQSDVIAKIIYLIKHKLTHYVGISQTDIFYPKNKRQKMINYILRKV